MTSKIKYIYFCVLLGMIISVCAGCSGSDDAPPPAPSTLVSGTASKGIVYPGSVSVYALDLSTGAKVLPALSTVSTNSNGQFSADLGSYSGPVIIEVVGTYTDEAATPPTQTVIDASRPMKTVVAEIAASQTRRVAVTPLTDLAASLALLPAGLPVTAAKISTAYSRVSELFKISDVSAVEPVAADAAVMASATLDQQAYTLALATLSQMAKSSSGAASPTFAQITSLLAGFSGDLSASATSGLSNGNSASFAQALAIVVQPGASLAGFTTAAATLGTVGSKITTITLTTGSASAAISAPIGAIEGSLHLPVTTSVRADALGLVLSGLFASTGSSADALRIAVFDPATRIISFKILTPRGFAGGDCAMVVIDAAGAIPALSSYTLSNLRVLDINGAALNIPVTLK